MTRKQTINALATENATKNANSQAKEDKNLQKPGGCTLQDLCPEDKKKVAGLLKQIVDQGNDIHKLKEQLKESQSEVGHLRQQHAEDMQENSGLRKKIAQMVLLLKTYHEKVQFLEANLAKAPPSAAALQKQNTVGCAVQGHSSDLQLANIQFEGLAYAANHHSSYAPGGQPCNESSSSAFAISGDAGNAPEVPRGAPENVTSASAMQQGTSNGAQSRHGVHVQSTTQTCLNSVTLQRDVYGTDTAKIGASGHTTVDAGTSSYTVSTPSIPSAVGPLLHINPGAHVNITIQHQCHITPSSSATQKDKDPSCISQDTPLQPYQQLSITASPHNLSDDGDNQERAQNDVFFVLSSSSSETQQPVLPSTSTAAEVRDGVHQQSQVDQQAVSTNHEGNQTTPVESQQGRADMADAQGASGGRNPALPLSSSKSPQQEQQNSGTTDCPRATKTVIVEAEAKASATALVEVQDVVGDAAVTPLCKSAAATQSQHGCSPLLVPPGSLADAAAAALLEWQQQQGLLPVGDVSSQTHQDSQLKRVLRFDPSIGQHGAFYFADVSVDGDPSALRQKGAWQDNASQRRRPSMEDSICEQHPSVPLTHDNLQRELSFAMTHASAGTEHDSRSQSTTKLSELHQGQQNNLNRDHATRFTSTYNHHQHQHCANVVHASPSHTLQDDLDDDLTETLSELNSELTLGSFPATPMTSRAASLQFTGVAGQPTHTGTSNHAAGQTSHAHSHRVPFASRDMNAGFNVDSVNRSGADKLNNPASTKSNSDYNAEEGFRPLVNDALHRLSKAVDSNTGTQPRRTPQFVTLESVLPGCKQQPQQHSQRVHSQHKHQQRPEPPRQVSHLPASPLLAMPASSNDSTSVVTGGASRCQHSALRNSRESVQSSGRYDGASSRMRPSSHDARMAAHDAGRSQHAQHDHQVHRMPQGSRRYDVSGSRPARPAQSVLDRVNHQAPGTRHAQHEQLGSKHGLADAPERMQAHTGSHHNDSDGDDEGINHANLRQAVHSHQEPSKRNSDSHRSASHGQSYNNGHSRNQGYDFDFDDSLTDIVMEVEASLYGGSDGSPRSDVFNAPSRRQATSHNPSMYHESSLTFPTYLQGALQSDMLEAHTIAVQAAVAAVQASQQVDRDLSIA